MNRSFNFKYQVICKRVFLAIVFTIKAIHYLLIYLLLHHLQIGLYPYLDIEDSFFSNIVSSNAVAFKFLFCLLSLFFAFISITIYSLVIFLKKRYFRKTLTVLLIISIIETAFLYNCFLKIQLLVDVVENCEFQHQVQVGCYVPPEFFEQ